MVNILATKSRLFNLNHTNQILSDAEYNTSGSLNRGGIADLPKLIETSQKYWEPSSQEVTDSFNFIAWVSLADSSTILQKLLTSVGLRQRRFIPIAKIIEMIYMSRGSSTSSWHPKNRVMNKLQPDIFIMTIYINFNLNPFKNFTQNDRIFKLKISYLGTILDDHKRKSQSVQK